MSDLVGSLMEELNCNVVFTIPLFGGIPILESVVVTWIIMAVLMAASLLLVHGLKVRQINNKQAALSASVILRIFSPEYSVCYLFILSGWSKNYPTITPAVGEGKEFLLMELNKKKTITKRRRNV